MWCVLPAVWYLVASLVKGDALSIITSELPRVTGGHLDLHQLGGGRGSAQISLHSREVKCVDTKQHWGLRRVAWHEKRKRKQCFLVLNNWVPHCNTWVVFVIIPIPQLWCFVKQDVASEGSLINCFSIWVDCQDVIIVENWLWANSSDCYFPHSVFKLANRTIRNGTILKLKDN